MSEPLRSKSVVKSIPRAIENLIAEYPNNIFYLAYSGGVDSTVLLHALSQSLRAKAANQIFALHVHHGLQADADHWLAHCQKQCEILQIECRVHFANIDQASIAVKQSGVEAVARQARYQYFAEQMQQDSCLLTAHHADDQAETFLLNALRGSGANGLAAMPKELPFAKGVLIRPFLNIKRKDIEAYARQFQLQWIEDASNQHDAFNRNYLRNQVLPSIASRWPSYSETLNRTTQLMAHTSEIEDALANQDATIIYEADQPYAKLAINKLLNLSVARRYNVLRYWLKQNAIKNLPSLAMLQEIDQILFAAEDALPEIKIEKLFIRRFMQHLYLVDTVQIDANLTFNWNLQAPLLLENNISIKPDDLGKLLPVLQEQQAVVQVGFRQGGEKIRLTGRQHRHQLKKLLQEKQIPPWQREQLPLIYFNKTLIAVLGLPNPILAADID